MAEYPPITICVVKPSDVNDVFKMLREKFGRDWIAIHTQSKQVKIITKAAICERVIASFELNKIKFFFAYSFVSKEYKCGGQSPS